MGYVLGLDLGTGSMKGVLVNKKGTVVKTISSEYPLYHPQSGYSEQNPQDWIDACDLILEEFIKTIEDFSEKLEAVSFSGQMHSLVLLDENDNVLRPAILWNDVRNTKQCEAIMKNYGKDLLEITHNIALEGFTLPKILWIQENEPEIWNKVAKVLLPKDYVRAWLTGSYFMDFSDAAGTLLLDTKKKIWSKEIMNKYSIPIEILPELIEATGYVGDIKDELASRYGFKRVKVFAGGADNACAAIAAGITSDNMAMVSIGTSGVFLTNEEKNHSEYEGKLHLFNHAIPNREYSMGVTLAAGNSLKWFKDTFAQNKTYDELLSEISEVELGAKGLLFTPYLSGERTPHVDSTIRGAFIGIDLQHSLKHFTRAVIEGITFSLKDSQELMSNIAGKDIDLIVSVGGGAKNKSWLQIQADIFGVKITSLKVEEGPGLGAAIIAAVGNQWFETIQTCVEEFIDYEEVIKPIPENVAKYKEIYKVYKQMYPQTKAITYDLEKIRM